MTPTDKHPALRFQVCQQAYALSVSQVVEVTAMMAATPLAGNAGPAIHGVIVRRGQPMVVVDLRRAFGCEKAPIDLSTLIIVIRHGKNWVGFVVDSVQGVIYFREEETRPANSETSFVRAVVVVGGTLLQWLDAAAVLAHTLPTDNANSPTEA